MKQKLAQIREAMESALSALDSIIAELEGEELVEEIAQRIRIANLLVITGHELCQEYESLEGSKILAEVAINAIICNGIDN